MKGIIKIYSAKIFLKLFLITKSPMRGGYILLHPNFILNFDHKIFTSGVNLILNFSKTDA